MRNALIFGVWLALLSTAAWAWGGQDATSNGYIYAGIGSVDITPSLPVAIVGGASAKQATTVDTRLYVKALVLSAGGKKLAIVTLDILKYPVEYVDQARAKIEQTTGIPAGNVIITASHTHSGPMWISYPDVLVTPIAEAVARAARDLAPCSVGIAKGLVEGVSQNRRVMIGGRAWNRWVLPPSADHQYPAEGPIDPEVEVPALVGNDGRYKAIVYNFACHAANTMRTPVVSADYPGHVQQYVEKHLEYKVATLFLTGACGNINPDYSVRQELFGEKLGGEIMRGLGRLEFIAQPAFWVESREVAMPGREHPEFSEKEIALEWPQALEMFKGSFYEMKKSEKPSYPYFFTGIRIGNDFAMVTNPDELFCEFGLGIKKQSPFKYTMVVEQTNGAYGYVPTAQAFNDGGYETWFGEHSQLTTRAGDIIEKESVGILNDL